MSNISWFSHTKNEIEVFYIKFSNIGLCTYFVYFKSKKELNYDRFVDPNVLRKYMNPKVMQINKCGIYQIL